MKKTSLLWACVILALSANSQNYNLAQLHRENKLVTNGSEIVPLSDSGKEGISLTGITWLKGVTFTEGTIDIDLRGKDVPQKSFIGIAFHAVDTAIYDGIYFRPFNFLATDPVRRIHAVQYTSEPDYPWHRTREEMNGIYEKAVNPAPNPNDWFHATIVVKGNEVNVYVNHSPTPSLTVKKLNARTDGMLGIWNNGLPGDFANLVVKK